MHARDARILALAVWLSWAVLSSSASAQTPPMSAEKAPRFPLPTAAADSPLVPPVDRVGHPLEPTLQFARVRYDYLRRNVRDFTCLLVKRERISERLRDYEYIKAAVRLRQVRDGRLVTPLSIYMHFLAPAQVRDRKVLYVENRDEGKMLVRNGGPRFSYVTVRISPDSAAAVRESRYPITEMSLETVARRMIERAEDDIKYDPDGTNTEVTFFRDARVEGRLCTRIRVVHPRRQENLSFHIANVYVDDELHMPVRVEGYDWPSRDETDPRLLEEYTFVKLRLNVGLTDADFSPSLVEN